MSESNSMVQNVAWNTSDEPTTELRVGVNGKEICAAVPDRLLLSDFLRDFLGLTALKVCCGEGACGACTVMIDGEPARSCTLLALQSDGSQIVTLEGMNAAGGLNQVQQIFKDCHALQCGYCTPGLLMTVQCMIARGVPPSSDDVTRYLSGHLCRCTGYRNILTAVRAGLGGEVRTPEQEDNG
jgi:aerobic-type carbon monoxide dehydrogenase small subunit (CoxS/CutS family)